MAGGGLERPGFLGFIILHQDDCSRTARMSCPLLSQEPSTNRPERLARSWGKALSGRSYAAGQASRSQRGAAARSPAHSSGSRSCAAPRCRIHQRHSAAGEAVAFVQQAMPSAPRCRAVHPVVPRIGRAMAAGRYNYQPGLQWRYLYSRDAVVKNSV